MFSVRYSRVNDYIRGMAELVAVNFGKKTLANFKGFLNEFNFINKSKTILSCDVEKRDISEMPEQLYEEMVKKEAIPKERVDKLIITMFSCGCMEEIINKARETVRNFPYDGKTYDRILELIYLGEATVPVKKARELMNYAESTFSVKMNQAIMIFGIAVWTEIKKYWKNAAEGMRRINRKYGLQE